MSYMISHMLWVGYCIQYTEIMLTTRPRSPAWFPLWLLLLGILCRLLFFSRSLKGWRSPGLPPELIFSFCIFFLWVISSISSTSPSIHLHTSIFTYRAQHTARQPRSTLRSYTRIGTLLVDARSLGWVKGMGETWEVNIYLQWRLLLVGKASPLPMHGEHACGPGNLEAT